MEDPMMPAMSMVWNWQTRHFQVVFPWWHVHSALDFVLTLSVIFTLSLMWEYLQLVRFQFDMQRYRQLQKAEERHGILHPEHSGMETESLGDASRIMIDRGDISSHPVSPISSSNKVFWKSSAMYTASHALSIFLMLAYMTFNGYIIVSNLLGAGLGYYFFRKNTFLTSSSKHCCD